MRLSPGVSSKFFDSLRNAPQAAAELFLVEGDSAAEAVCAVRNPALQAVLPLQGKPMNALKATPGRLLASPWFAALTAVLGDAPGTALPLGTLRYERVLLLMDPDADGIHAGALVQLFFYRCMPTLLESGRLEIVHAPWGEIRRGGDEPLLSFHAAQFQQQCRALEAVAGARHERIRYRGLGTITPEILERCCVNLATRHTRVLGITDAELAAAAFGPRTAVQGGGGGGGGGAR